MLDQAKKKAMNTAMKLMMNEKVAKTVMMAIQKKNDFNDRLAKIYSVAQIPSLNDHQNLKYALDRTRSRIKAVEKEIEKAEVALDKVEIAFEEMVKKPKPVKKKAAPKKPAVKKAAKKAVKAKKATTKKAVKKTAPKKAAKKAAKANNIKPLNAATNNTPASGGGLLDLDFAKSGKKTKKS